MIRAGLRALQERDAAVERWLCNEVVSIAAAMQADGDRAMAYIERIEAYCRGFANFPERGL